MTENLKRDNQRIREMRDPLIGKYVDGEFLILSWIGRGSFSNVYRAAQTSVNDRQVALKVIRKAQSTHAQAKTGLVETNPFEHELHINRMLKHAAVVRAIKAGRTQNGIDYIAMELVEGENLDRHLRSEGPLAVSDVIELADALLGFVGEMHDVGCIHCDIKPDNLMFKRLPNGSLRFKVLDLGQARFFKAQDSDRPQFRGSVVGTPAFIAPEVARGAAPDPLSEIYACGTVLYEALTGMHALHIERPSVEEYVAYLRDPDEPIPTHPISAIRDDIPAGLTELVESCLSRDRKQRPQSIAALHEAILGLDHEIGDEEEAGAGLVDRARGAFRKLFGR
jgi:serine/threonine-protein kinase